MGIPAHTGRWVTCTHTHAAEAQRAVRGLLVCTHLPLCACAWLCTVQSYTHIGSGISSTDMRRAHVHRIPAPQKHECPYTTYMYAHQLLQALVVGDRVGEKAPPEPQAVDVLPAVDAPEGFLVDLGQSLQ